MVEKFRVVLAKPDEKLIAKFSTSYASLEATEKTAWQTLMAETADLSGGDAYYLENPEDGEMIYSNIFQVIENRDMIGYYPKNELKGHPEYRVMGRKSYFAQEEEK